MIRYRPESIVAILDSERAAGDTQDGFPVVRSVEEARQYEPTTALVGVATTGGRFPPLWRDLLKDVIRAGLDLESGLHEFVSDDPELVELAREHGVELRDLRKPPPGLNVPTGANLTHGATTVLTVGSDCAIGKMTVSLELDREARSRGIKSEFVRPGRRESRSRVGGSPSTQSSPISSPALPSSSSSKGSSVGVSYCSSKDRARCSTRTTPASRSG